MLSECESAVCGQSRVRCMARVLTAAAKGEAGDRREEDFVVVFDRVKDRPQSAHLFRNETIRGVNNLAQHGPTPPPPFLIASARVSSSCLNLVLVLPNRSSTTVVSADMQSAKSAAAKASQDFLPSTQLFCVRSLTRYPVCLSCEIVRCI